VSCRAETLISERAAGMAPTSALYAQYAATRNSTRLRARKTVNDGVHATEGSNRTSKPLGDCRSPFGPPTMNRSIYCLTSPKGTAYKTDGAHPRNTLLLAFPLTEESIVFVAEPYDSLMPDLH